MLSGNVNTLTMIVIGLMILVLIVMFALYALLNNNNTQTLAESVRTALIQNRDDAARVNSNTLYPLNIPEFQKQVSRTHLKEIGGKQVNHVNGHQAYSFYYLLQNGQLVDVNDYKTKIPNGGNRLNRMGATLIKGVTVDVTVKTNSTKNVKKGPMNDHEQQLKSTPGTKRYSVTYLVDGGVVKEPSDSNDEASRLLPKSYQQRGSHKVNGSTMVNLTDN